MPGIFGVAGDCGGTDVATLLGAMARTVKHHDWYVQEQHVDDAGRLAFGRTSLGFVNRGPQPAGNEDGSVLCFMDGEIYEAQVWRDKLASAGHCFASQSQAEILIHGYEESGLAFFAGLHGYFSAALWDTGAGKLLLLNDRFGMRPLYYAHVSGRLLFGSEIKALLQDPAVRWQHNLRGMAQFFTFGQLLGEDSFLEDVHLLPAAGVLTYEVAADHVTVSRYWHQAVPALPPGQTLIDALDQVDAALTRAVNRRLSEDTTLGLSLSGGLDARTILGLTDTHRYPLTTVSLGMEGSLDLQCAAEMARLTGCRHHAYTLNTDFLSQYEDHLRWMVHLTDGQHLCQCIVMPTLPLYRELGIEVLLRGHAGELMHMNKAYNFSLDYDALAIRSDAALEEWLLRHLSAYMLDGIDGPLLRRASRRELDQLARESLRACLQDCQPANPPVQRIWQLFLNQRLRRETATAMVEFHSLVETRMPFLDHEVVDLLLALPPEWKISDRIQHHILARHRPEFLRIINANIGSPMTAGPLRRLFGQARLKAFAKLGVRGYQPYERLGLWLRRELRPLVEKLLLSDRFADRGVFEPQTVRKTVQAHFDGRNHTYLLLALMIFETAQRQFVDGDRQPKTAAQAVAV